MKITTTLAIAVGLAGLAACNKTPEANNVEMNAENTTENLETAPVNTTSEAAEPNMANADMNAATNNDAYANNTQ
jgi:hypothetical protein